MADHLDRLLDGTYRHLGEDATWYPLTGAVTAVRVIPELQQAGEGFGPVGVTAEARALRVRRSELSAPSPEKGDRVEWDGMRWLIAQKPRYGDARNREWVCVIERDC